MSKHSNMKSTCESFNITNEIFKRSRKHCNKITTRIRRFAEKKTAESPSVNKPVTLTENVKATIIVAFSSDDTLMASTHGDHNVRITDVRTQECIMTLVGHPRTPWCVTFHPSSNEILASGCLGGEVRVWDLHGGSEVWVSEHHNAISSLSFHPQDQVLAIATSNQISLWNWSQPKPFASVKTACLNERVRLIRFSTYGDFLLTGISNKPREENDVDVSHSSMFADNRNSAGSFQRPLSRRFFQFRQDDDDSFEIQRPPRRGNEIPYTQTVEYRVRRANARRDRLNTAEVTLAHASNQSREIHNLLSRSDESVSTDNQEINSRSLLSQARNYAASVTLETVANRATDALVSGEAHRAAGRDAMSHRQILDSVLSNLQNQSAEIPRSRDHSILTQRRTNSVFGTAIQHRPFRQRINAWRSPDSRTENNESRTPTALELRTILHPELSLTTTTSDANSNVDSNSMQSADSPSSSSQLNERSSSDNLLPSSTITPTSNTSNSNNTNVQSCSASTSREQIQRPSTSQSSSSSSFIASTFLPSTSSSSSRHHCLHHQNRALVRRMERIDRVRQSIRERVRERVEARYSEQDGSRPTDPAGLSNIRRIARRIQNPGPLTRSWTSRRKYRGQRLAGVSGDDTHREVRRSRLGFHRLSRGMERVRPAQQPLHRHYDVSIFDEEIGRPPRNVHAVVNRAIADAFLVRGETAVANNIKSTTHRLQWWDFTKQELPDISDAKSCLIVPHCKIHNDNSCDLSQDGRLLATFVPSPFGFPDNGVLAIYSLMPNNFGDVLYTKSFGPNAICTSLSPLGTYVVVGLAARRLHCLNQTSRRTMAQVFKMQEPYGGENSLVQVNSILHNGDGDQRQNASVNVVKWIPSPGAGIAYGTTKGDLRICVASPSVTINEDQNQQSNGNGDMYSRYSIDPVQRARLYNDISLMALGMQFPDDPGSERAGARVPRVARATQTGEDDDEPMERRSTSSMSSTSTQTEQPLVIEAAQDGDSNSSQEGVPLDPVLAGEQPAEEQQNPGEEANADERGDVEMGEVVNADERGDVELGDVVIDGAQNQHHSDTEESRDRETGESV
ncbi:activating molecule in BECN1-regulated autophagy protein 1B-like [Antedon mediterranea]|uniref:activating molecule in BECN1-regulated autophagy protein 1B-like n=1 Tax=Antedon mediterranea TaxID=105859 RepID=UPI003AF50049